MSNEVDFFEVRCSGDTHIFTESDICLCNKKQAILEEIEPPEWVPAEKRYGIFYKMVSVVDAPLQQKPIPMPSRIITLICPQCAHEFDIAVEHAEQVPEVVAQSGKRMCPSCA